MGNTNCIAVGYFVQRISMWPLSRALVCHVPKLSGTQRAHPTSSSCEVISGGKDNTQHVPDLALTVHCVYPVISSGRKPRGSRNSA